MSNENNYQSFLKKYGFLDHNSEIYKGVSNSWFFGINGSEVKENLKKLWKIWFIDKENNYFCDTPILTKESVLDSSGHKKNFNDLSFKCKKCGLIERVDKEEIIKCKICKTSNSDFFKSNLMLKTNISINNEEKKYLYMRPETCQGIFVNFNSLMNSVKRNLPYGFGQIGKSFRNEITKQHGLFRGREFEQAEFEFFYLNDDNYWWNYWLNSSLKFVKSLIWNFNEEFLKTKDIEKENLPHYSNKTIDLYYYYSFGWGEISSISNRGEYDLKNHGKSTNSFIGIFNSNKIKEIPKLIEVSFGIDRLFLMIMESSYKKRKDEEKYFLSINPLLSTYFVSIFSLNKKLEIFSLDIYKNLLLNCNFKISYEKATNSVGKNYLNNDIIGTFFSIVIDFNYEKTKEVTIRERDSKKQINIKYENLSEYLNEKYLNLRKLFIS